MNTHRMTAATVAATVSLLLLAGCDRDGDGYDDETGQPVPAISQHHDTAKEPSRSSGCDPDGFGPFSGCDSEDRDRDTGHDEPAHFALEPAIAGELPWRARHEAGHKAVADAYGWTVTSVWLRPDGSGRTNVRGFRLKDPRQRLVLLYAGAIAAGTDDGADEDFSDAEDILDRTPSTSEQAARDEAARIVSARSAEIDRDAAELRKNGELR